MLKSVSCLQEITHSGPTAKCTHWRRRVGFTPQVQQIHSSKTRWRLENTWLIGWGLKKEGRKGNLATVIPWALWRGGHPFPAAAGCFLTQSHRAELHRHLLCSLAQAGTKDEAHPQVQPQWLRPHQNPAPHPIAAQGGARAHWSPGAGNPASSFWIPARSPGTYP